MSATTEQLEYLVSLGVTVGTPPVATPPTPVVVPVPAAPVANQCPPPPPEAELMPVAVPAPNPGKPKENSWWIGLLASTTVVFLMLIVFLLTKGCNP